MIFSLVGEPQNIIPLAGVQGVWYGEVAVGGLRGPAGEPK